MVPWRRARGPVKVGVLHLLSGPYAAYTKRMLKGELLAIEEINSRGGVAGHPIEPLVVDTTATPEGAEEAAERLLGEHQVAAIIGCDGSATRRAVIRVVERHDSLLIYPMAFESLERSAHVFYLGATPNQCTIPAVGWLLENRGSSFFLIGLDGPTPRSMTTIINDALVDRGGRLAGLEYFGPAERDFGPIIDHALDLKPDVIVVMAPSARPELFRRLARERNRRISVLSWLLNEGLAAQVPEGVSCFVTEPYQDYADRPANHAFLTRYRNAYGTDTRPEENAQNAYLAPHLWAAAVRKAHSTRAPEVRAALRGQRFEAPEGTVWVDEQSQYLWRTARMAGTGRDGGFEALWHSEVVLRPAPFPPYRTRRDWAEVVDGQLAATGR